jgi:zinc and cadmium transporter
MDYLLLLSTIAAGAVTVFVLRLDARAQVKLVNAFAGAYLLCVTFLHLLPEVYAGDTHGHGAGHAVSPLTVGLLMLGGFFIQVLLDVISLGVEHGHVHTVEKRLPLGVILGLCLHAFVEALALGDPLQHHDPASRRMLLWSIVLHNYPVTVALLGMLLHSGLTRRQSLTWLGVFALMAPLGLSLSQHTVLTHYTRELTAVVIGIFMHIATTILFESSDLHRFNWAKVGAIVLGLALGGATVALH